MKRLTKWIVKTFIEDYENTEDRLVRSRYGLIEGWMSVTGNLLLFIVKIIPGFLTGSISLIADAFHTLADTGSSIVVLVGFRASKKPSDPDHPFGHERLENITGLIVAVLIAVTGVEFMLRSVERFLHPTEVESGWIVIGVLVATLPVKWMMAAFAGELGEMLDSSALEGDAWHHMSDVFATLAVILALIASKYGYGVLDSVAGVVVALIIIFAGYKIGREAISPLIGEAPETEFLNEIEDIVMSFEEVESMHDIIVHSYGTTKLVSLHIEILDEISLMDSHHLAEDVEDELADKLNVTPVVHVDPINKDFKYYEEIEAEIETIISRDERIDSFHDLRIVGSEKKANVIFDISVKERIKAQKYDSIEKKLVDPLKERFGFIEDVIVKIEPVFKYR